MDQYFRDFQIYTIPTYEVLTINDDKQNFKILNTNIRSNGKNIEEFIINIDRINSDIDCLISTETRNIQDKHLFNIAGYNILYNESGFNQNDGVIVYLRKTYAFSYEIIEIFNNRKAIEIEILLEGRLNAVITAVYRSPDSNAQEFVAKPVCPVITNL